MAVLKNVRTILAREDSVNGGIVESSRCFERSSLIECDEKTILKPKTFKDYIKFEKLIGEGRYGKVIIIFII